MNNIKVGDRFWTPSKKIESAKITGLSLKIRNFYL